MTNTADTNGNKLRSLMTWIRLLLPITLAALGWYIGQTVGKLDDRLETIETADTLLREEFVEHRAEEQSWKIEIERRQAQDEAEQKDHITSERFQTRTKNLERRIERLEDRMNASTDKKE